MVLTPVRGDGSLVVRDRKLDEENGKVPPPCSSLEDKNKVNAQMFAFAMHFSRVGQVHKVCRVGQNRIYTPYMTVYLEISLPKISYIHRIYMVLANFKSVYTAFFGRDSLLLYNIRSYMAYLYGLDQHHHISPI
jgi:hypothetical protein